MAAAIGAGNDLRELGRQVPQPGGVVIADLADDVAVGGSPAHRDQVGQGRQLLLAVGDQRAELRQAVEGGAEDQPRGGVFAAREPLADGHKRGAQSVFAVKEQARGPEAGLNLVRHRGHVVFAAQLVGSLEELA